MPQETEAERFLASLHVPPGLEGKLNMVTNEDGSVTVTNPRTGVEHTITKEQAAQAMERR